MPRQSKQSDILHTLQIEAQRVLAILEDEIGRVESHLGDLRNQASVWASVMKGKLTRRGPGRPPGRPPGRRPGRPPGRPPGSGLKARKVRVKRRGPEIDWTKVLSRMPKRFTMQNVAKATPKLASNPQARVIAIARWSRSGLIKKVGDGQYQRS